MTTSKREEADRNYRNFHTCASWTSFMDKEQVNYILQERGDFIYCNGTPRQLNIEPITSDTFKVTTKSY